MVYESNGSDPKDMTADQTILLAQVAADDDDNDNIKYTNDKYTHNIYTNDNEETAAPTLPEDEGIGLGVESVKRTRLAERSISSAGGVSLSQPGVILVRGPSYISAIEDDTSNHGLPDLPFHEGDAAISVTATTAEETPIHATLVPDEAEDRHSHESQPGGEDQQHQQLVEAKVLPVRTYVILAAIVCMALVGSIVGIVVTQLTKEESTVSPTMSPTVNYAQRLVEGYDHVVSFVVTVVSILTDQCQLLDENGNSSNWLVTASCLDHGVPTDLYLVGHHPLTKCDRVDDSTITCRLKVPIHGRFATKDAIAFVCGAKGPPFQATARAVVEGLSLHNCTSHVIAEPAQLTVALNTFCVGGDDSGEDSNVQCNYSSRNNESQTEVPSCTWNATNPCRSDVATTGCSNGTMAFLDQTWAVKTTNNENCFSPSWETNELYGIVDFLVTTVSLS